MIIDDKYVINILEGQDREIQQLKKELEYWQNMVKAQEEIFLKKAKEP